MTSRDIDLWFRGQTHSPGKATRSEMVRMICYLIKYHVKMVKKGLGMQFGMTFVKYQHGLKLIVCS